MPIFPPAVIPNQVQPNAGALPYVQQMNFGQMIGDASAWNPNAIGKLPVWINEIVRAIYDIRTWYGLYTEAQVITPQAVNGGTATTTLNSNIVQGNNTNWDASLVGRQFRQGLTCPPYTIQSVNFAAQQLILTLPFGAPFPPNQNTRTSGYFIVQMYYNLGPNIKYLKQMVNFQMGFKLRLNLTQDFMDNKDAWRFTVNFPVGVAPRPADQNGNYLVELWPAPFNQQVLPFYAYTQPPNLVDDNDSLPPYIRCDVVTKEAACWALRYNPKQNPGYSEGAALRLADTFHQEHLALLQGMAEADDNLYRISATIPGEDLPFYTPGGAMWSAMHAISDDSGDWWS